MTLTDRKCLGFVFCFFFCLFLLFFFHKTLVTNMGTARLAAPMPGRQTICCSGLQWRIRKCV